MNTEILSTEVPPALRLHQLGIGYWISQALYVTAKLGVADVLARGPQPVEIIAETVGANTGALYRLLRALAGCEVFTETTPRCFSLTAIGELLRSDVPGSMRALAMTMELDWQAWGQMLHSVRTGHNAFAHVHGEGFFAHLQQHTDKAMIFDQAMTGFVMAHGVAVAAAYDFSPFTTVVDVGGGHGALISAILTAHPSVQGVLFDLPSVIPGAEQALAVNGLNSRCRCIGGDFFTAVPVGGDAYVLGSILHDWDDTHSLALLRNCRQAIADQGRLLIVEMVIPEGDTPFFGKLLDLQMLVSFGGRERTASEYTQLLAQAGFQLNRILPTQALPSVLEAVPV